MPTPLVNFSAAKRRCVIRLVSGINICGGCFIESETYSITITGKMSQAAYMYQRQTQLELDIPYQTLTSRNIVIHLNCFAPGKDIAANEI